MATPTPSPKKAISAIRWNTEAHEDLLLAYILKFKVGRAELNFLSAKMTEMGYTVTNKAISLHILKAKQTGWGRHGPATLARLIGNGDREGDDDEPAPTVPAKTKAGGTTRKKAASTAAGRKRKAANAADDDHGVVKTEDGESASPTKKARVGSDLDGVKVEGFVKEESRDY